jgi:peptide/nickel transport system substrate-binding protein
VTRLLKLLVGVLLVGGILLGLGFWRSARPSPQLAESALVASLRSEPGQYNRYVEATAAADLVSLLTDDRLVRVNRATDALEPALAEGWVRSDDGLTYTLALRRDVRFSDGAPFTSADVLFSTRVVYDPALRGGLASAMLVNGEPIAFDAPDDFTVRMTLPSAFAPGVRVLEHVPILPRHKLLDAYENGTFAEAWRIGMRLEDRAGLGPFRLTEHVSGQRLVFERNPHYWERDESGTRLPYLDRLTVVVIPDQNTEALRLESGDIDLMAVGDIRPEDYAAFKRASDAGQLRLMEAGVSLDANLLLFNLTEEGRARAPWLQDRRVRQAISFAVDRQAIVDTVYLGAAVPIFGPITPGNTTWASGTVPQYPGDPGRARQLLASAGLADRDGDGTLDDPAGRPVRFSILTQAGHTLRERTVSVIQEHLREVGIAVDVVTLDVKGIPERWMKRDYDAIYFGLQTSATDPAFSVGFWLSSGHFHLWNPAQTSPATDWEARIDDLMRRQVAAPTLEERQRLFGEIQRIFGEELPAIYFAAPKVTLAVSPRVKNARPAIQAPQLLWAAEGLAVN